MPWLMPSQPGVNPVGLVGVLDPSHFFVRREIHDRESVGLIQLCEDPVSRAVGIALDDQRQYPLVVGKLPGDFHLLEIEDGNDMSARRAGRSKFAVCGQRHVVQPSFHRDALDPLQRFGIDNIQRPGIQRLCAGVADADHDQLSVAGHHRIVGPAAERHFLKIFPLLRSITSRTSSLRVAI